MKEMLELRKSIKKKKPNFIRQDSHKRIEVPERWRKPKGRQSKIKKRFAGHRKMPNPGYGSPKQVKGLHKSGLKPVVVSTHTDFQKINSKTEGAVISRGTGKRKAAELLAKAKESEIQVLNVRDIDRKISEIAEGLSARKEERKKRKDRKAAKTREQKKKEEKKKDDKTKEEKKTEEKTEEKDKQKKELDKALIERTQ